MRRNEVYMNAEMLHLEKLRKKSATVLICIAALSTFMTIASLSVIASITSVKFEMFYFMFLWIVFGLLFAKVFGYRKCSQEYKAYFKSILVEIPFRNAFGEVLYINDLGFEKILIQKCDMLCFGNRYASNDYVQGTYKNIKFERADVTIQQETSRRGHGYTTTYFSGRWIIFEFNEDFHFDLQILGRGFYNSPAIRPFSPSEEERLHQIEGKDLRFNEKFIVFGQDDNDALHILTPQLMDVLKNMSATLDGSFMLAFIDNQLHVAIDTGKDAMETAILGHNDRPLIEQEVKREINAIISIIDGLSLDRDFYKKLEG